jgi:hypothetical protein
LEEQVGGLGFEGDAADLVNDQQGVAAEPDDFALQPARRALSILSWDPFVGSTTKMILSIDRSRSMI